MTMLCLDDLDDLVPERESGEFPSYGLRWYQREGKAAAEASLKAQRATLIVMATGLGKTRLGSAVSGDWAGGVLWLAHRDELVQQAAEALEALTGEAVEIEKGELRASSRARIVVGSVQTLCKQKRLERFARDRFTLIIVDEAHHYVAKTYRRPLDYFAGAKLLGLTATPDRGDHKALGKIFDRVGYCFDIERGIDQGYLVPIEGKTVRLDEIDLSQVGKTGGDLIAAQLDEAMLKAVEGIVRETVRLAPERQGILFFPGVKTAELAASRLNTLKPGSATFISGTTDEDERRQLVKDFKAGRIQYLCNCQIATEGFDAPAVSLIVMGRPTLSRALFAQMLGRGTRTLPGLVDSLDGPEAAAERKAAIEGSRKPSCLVLDFVGNSGKHTLVTPEDILGGSYSEAEVKLAKRKAKEAGGGDPRTLLQAAREELRRVAASVRSRVKSTVESFNPFSVLHMEPTKDSMRFGYKPISPGQADALKRMGLSKQDMVGLSKDDAHRLLGAAAIRRKHGLASYKQLSLLRERGVTEVNIPAHRASQALGYIFEQTNSGKAADPMMVRLILSAAREPGED